MKEMRVFGPPGCGKTTFLARQVARAADELGSDNVLVASFTKTAAAEIGSRDLGLGEKQVGTLHSFANRAIGGSKIVEDRAGLTAWNDMHWRDDRRLSMGVKHEELDFGDDMQPNQTEGDRLFSEYKWLRAKMTPRTEWAPSVLAFGKDWEDFKTRKQGIDFTDQIEIALNERAVPHGNWAAAFFDEVQDFSALELAYARLIGGGCEHFILAGDPNQCIFSFKGASPDAFLNPTIPKEQIRVLSQSWRVPAAVHKFALGWQLIELDYRPRDEPGKVRQAYGWSVRDPEYAPFAGEAENLIKEGKSVMFLTSASYMLRNLVRSLKQRKLPFGNTYRPEQPEWNPLKSSKPWDPVSRVLALLRDDPEIHGQQARVHTYAELWQAAEHLEFSAFRPGVKASLKNSAGNKILKNQTVEDREGYLTPGAFQGTAKQRLLWFVRNMWSKKQSDYLYLLEVIERYGWDVLREPPPITVGTIHSVKGAQADVVYLFPELSPSAGRAWDRWRSEERNAIIRTYYVGATRAREELVLCDVDRNGVSWQDYHAPAVVTR